MKNAIYDSKTIQDEIIGVLGGIISEDIVQRVQNAPFFSVIADEEQDVSSTEQLSLVL